MKRKMKRRMAWIAATTMLGRERMKSKNRRRMAWIAATTTLGSGRRRMAWTAATMEAWLYFPLYSAVSCDLALRH
jgi:hypothetical protein